MTTVNVITYGEGGYDPSKPDNNILSTEEVEAPDATPTADERLADVEETLAVLAVVTAELLGGAA